LGRGKEQWASLSIFHFSEIAREGKGKKKKERRRGTEDCDFPFSFHHLLKRGGVRRRDEGSIISSSLAPSFLERREGRGGDEKKQLLVSHLHGEKKGRGGEVPSLIKAATWLSIGKGGRPPPLAP